MEQGYKNTSVSDIANELGIAQGLVFHYFKSKAILLYTIFDQIAAEQQQAMESYLTQLDSKTIDIFGMLFHQDEQHQKFERLFDDLKDDPAVHEYLQDKITQLPIDLVVDIIESGNRDGSWQCEYPQETALVIIHGFSSLVRSLHGGELADPSRIENAAQDIIYRLFGVRNETSQH